MYKDRTRVRDNPIRIYLNDHEQAEIEAAAIASGRERAVFIRDAALVVSRFVRRCRERSRTADLLHQVQVNLAAAAANDDDNPMFSLAQ